jgi:hypothetical protein
MFMAPCQIDLQDLLPRLVGQTVNLSATMNACVVNQRVNSTKASQDRVNRFTD